MVQVDRLERLTDLVMVLLAADRPVTLQQIADQVPGYPPPGEARRQAFERDKRTLRDEGVVVSTEPIPGPEQMGYRIKAGDYYLPALDLLPDEAAALNLAVAFTDLGAPSGRNALWSLGIVGADVPLPAVDLPAVPHLAAVHEALRRQQTLEFSYRGSRRLVDPAQLRFRGGRWYLVAYDRTREAPRAYRMDRFEGRPSAGADGSGSLPADFDADEVLPNEPWRIAAGDGEPVDVLVDAILAPRVLALIGEGAVQDRRSNGDVVFRLMVSNVEAFRAWLIDLGARAEILGPETVRADFASWLRLALESDR